jgi:hypothetical protein
MTTEQGPWKCGDEFLPFHPDASHVPTEYRDGWNRCYYAARSLLASGVPAGEPIQHHPVNPAVGDSTVPAASPFSGQHAIGGGELPARPLARTQIAAIARDAQIAYCLDKHASYEEAVVRGVEAAHGIAAMEKPC